VCFFLRCCCSGCYSAAVCGLGTSSLRTSKTAAAAAEAASLQQSTTAAAAAAAVAAVAAVAADTTAVAAVAMVEVPCRIGTPSPATYVKVLQALVGAGRSTDAAAVAELAQSMPWYAAQGAAVRTLVQHIATAAPAAVTPTALTAPST
jgi:hypothetical protein